ncbi:MAG: glycosyltransferase family 4 protein [Rugosibacter sp.]|nr:glycosyltransferase family 4 protein [Rugosibacter sp.]
MFPEKQGLPPSEQSAKGGTARLKVAMVTNIPAPYRLPVFEQVAAAPDIEFCAFFCSGREPDREWDLAASKFKQVFLREKFINFRGRFIHINPDLWGKLRAFRPDVVITTGFNPTHLLAYAYARLHGARHIAMTDGTYQSETKLSWIHRWVRRRVYSGTQAFIGASDGSLALYRSYGIDSKRLFKSHLCANNAAFFNAPTVEKRFDFIFCGRFVAMKNPLFAIEVARCVAQRLGRRVSTLFVGSGEMEPEMRAAGVTAAQEVTCEFAGFAYQDELPKLYGSARILFFPTQWDVWGVVANEACAAGLPILVSTFAGTIGDLIRDGENGFVLPLDVQRWTDASVRLLSDSDLYDAMSARGRALVQEYSFENAAAGIVNAVRMSVATQEQKSLAPYQFSNTQRARVVIIQRRMTHYRIPLFELMRDQLGKAGIELIVVFGDPTPEEQEKEDSGTLSWGVYVPCTYWLNGRICWQNSSAAIRGADLVVVTQENRLLFNYFLGIFQRPKALAFWGHGRNFQASNLQSLSEQIKRRLVTKADWWFAYTELSARAVMDAGFPMEQITVLNNSIDTQALASDLDGVMNTDLHQAREMFDIGVGTVGIMIGSLHADKQLDFLFEAARCLRQSIPDFQLVIVGDGSLRGKVQQAVTNSDGWIHWLGARKGREKALLLKISKVMLNPGMVGLGILDSFVAKVPMVTTAYEYHSPEIAYLEHGINGLMTPVDVDAYSTAVLGLLDDEVLYRKLQEGCEHSAEKISLEKMANRFCEGITRCLEKHGVMPIADKTA